MSWTLVEPCCGSGALTMHLLGARRSLVPYQGTKWSLRREIAALLPFEGPPSRVVLSDVSMWSTALRCVLTQRDAVRERLATLVWQGERDPEALYARLAAAPVPDDEVRATAVLLWLQRMNYASKAVGDVAGRWQTHGLSKGAAFGQAATAKFGAVKPLGGYLLKGVKKAPVLSHVVSYREIAPVQVEGPTVVYIDPPYEGTTAYPSGSLTRADVVDYAQRWAAAGAHVLVSEATPISELRWATQRIRASKRSGQQFRLVARGEEWVTYSSESTSGTSGAASSRSGGTAG